MPVPIILEELLSHCPRRARLLFKMFTRGAYSTAWLVHLYTASGAVVAFLIFFQETRGHHISALWLCLLAVIIDSTDGYWARRLKVREILPSFDGSRLDYIIDFLTYVFAPVFILWHGAYLPSGLAGMLLASVALIVACYQFCQTESKTSDHYFLGFPVYWNAVVFYVVIFGLTPIIVSIILLILSALVFVPIRYIYPSRTVSCKRVSIMLTVLWFFNIALILYWMPNPPRWICLLSLIYPCYYFTVSFYLSYRVLVNNKTS